MEIERLRARRIVASQQSQSDWTPLDVFPHTQSHFRTRTKVVVEGFQSHLKPRARGKNPCGPSVRRVWYCS